MINTWFSKAQHVTLAFVLAVSVAAGSIAATPINEVHAANSPLHYTQQPSISLDPNANTVTGRNFRPYDLVTVSVYQVATGLWLASTYAYVHSDGTFTV